ncbi:cytochrome C [Geobacter hydrogenophilus]|uniref:Outer membrane cytochrome MtrC/MtrF-like domain-containing protein n=1 Tax=Geobacter hydrogenophilus TaxID=40983 RepID=A0A9W6G1Y4_9BACT|nr:multiheme c-type cytochrome [Geobacter hydrogenophilus]MBT0894466.1 cytochrome C [Geobacter hydrogenophilus]GLI39379.1 hypothetical protein GHYDROH2_28800 [Geobacter hydrogenophilus]
MKTRLRLSALLLAMVCAGCGGDGAGDPPAPYSLIAWNDLGMHCIDNDYSVFAILPPYNNLHAQLIDRQTGKQVTAGVTVTYTATADTRGSINSTSKGKTNFWQWVSSLFGVTLPADTGLTGNRTPGAAPAPMSYDPAAGFWKADGIPILPRDDAGTPNYYPMVKVEARDGRGVLIATTFTVLPVSDELACSKCHTSGVGDPMAQPSPDWVFDANPVKDWRRNILRLHDTKNGATPLYADALAQKGYLPAGLLATSDAGTPILCAGCHPSNALGTTGVAGVKQLTTSMHSWHAVNAMDDATGMPLGQTMDRSGCYYCHPGSTTQCLRGVMGNAKNPDGSSALECQSCHGSMSVVGGVGRAGWIDLPKCQYCHYQATDGTYVRDTSAFDLSGNFRQATSIFSTGQALFKVGATHGNMQCEACHGSTHAEYPSSEDNDNAQSINLQGYAGTIAECVVCHPQGFSPSAAGGPHGLHTIGAAWVDTHGSVAKDDSQACTVCHGKDYRGTRLSRTFTARSLRTTSAGMKAYAKGDMVGCYDCHNGPGGK